MPDVVKIGMTTRGDIQTRMKELYGTGVPLPFECKYACRVNSDDCLKIEQALHTAFAPHRVNKRREFFRILPEQVIAILKILDTNIEDEITRDLNNEINKTLNEEDRLAVDNERKRRPNLNFIDMQIPIGATLDYTLDNAIKVKVVSKNKIIYNDQEMYLSAITCQLLGKEANYGVVPTNYWLYQGRLLRYIYNETYQNIDC